MTELDRLHNENARSCFLSMSKEQWLDGSPRTRAGERNARVDRWFEVVPQHRNANVRDHEDCKRGCRSLDALIAEYCDAARRELLGEIDATVQIVSSASLVFCRIMRGELMDLIESEFTTT